MNHRGPRPSHFGCFPTRFRGLTLFEVVIALAIFVGSMAAIGQLVASGVRGALRARLQTQAILRSESKMAELVAGITPLQAANQVPFPDNPSWTWSAALAPTSTADLYQVEVTAAHAAGGNLGDVSFSLSRLVRNPQAFLEAMQNAEEQAAEAASASGAGS